MTEQDQIKALAELDGWVQVLEPLHHLHGNEKRMGRKTGGDWMILPDYLHSYDAIIPCLVRRKLWAKIIDKFRNDPPTPSDLCREVLIEERKWKP